VRVLVVTDWFAEEGGTERYVELVVDSLRDDGHEVGLMTSSAGSAAGGRADYVAFGTGARAAQVALQVVNPFAVATLRRALREFRPDAVHLTLFLAHLSPAILAPLRDLPTLLLLVDYKPVCMNSTRIRRDGSPCDSAAGAVCWKGGCVSLPHYLRDRVRYRLMRDGMAHVNEARTISSSMQRTFGQAGIHAEPMVLPVARPSSRFARRRASAPTFVYGGRFAPVKGVDVLLRAFSRVVAERPRARLRLYGDGAEKPHLMGLADRLGLGSSVEWHTGMAPGWADAIGDAWAAVVPSVFPEPLGLVAIEAVVRGIPVIASDTGGLSETIQTGVTGTLVAPGDAGALARTMIEYADRPPDVPADIVRAMRERHDPLAHARALEALFSRRDVVAA
jgi:glycosyltransferase involved in cell wall biosynthesis